METSAAMEVISHETVEADKVKQVVSQEEAVASEEAAKVKAIKDECEADLAEALPMLEAALKVCVGGGWCRGGCWAACSVRTPSDTGAHVHTHARVRMHVCVRTHPRACARRP